MADEKLDEGENSVIAVIQGESLTDRIVFAIQRYDCERPIVMQQESFSEGVGWFVQNRIEMTRSEMSQLRTVLGGKLPSACEFTAQRIRNQNPHLRIHKVSAAS